MATDAVVTAPQPSGRRWAQLPLSGDERLARSVAKGDQRAFSTLYERYHQQLYRYARSLVRNDSDAQDALQSAMANALIALREDRRDAPVRPWLYRIVHNESISLIRKRHANAELSEAEMLTGSSTEERVEERTRLLTLVSDLQALPERQRGALVMHELSGLSHDEIAAAFGVSNGVARQLVYEARRSLQDFSEGRTMSCDDICRAVSNGDRRALRSRKIRAHMRECQGCTAFAEAIPTRTKDLKAIAPPLPAAAAAGILAHALGAGSGHATSATTAAAVSAGSSGAGVVGAGAATAGKTALLALSTKAVAGIVVVAAATAGVDVAVQHLSATPAKDHSALTRQTTPGKSAVSGKANAGSQSGTHAQSQNATSTHGATNSHASSTGKTASHRQHAPGATNATAGAGKPSTAGKSGNAGNHASSVGAGSSSGGASGAAHSGTASSHGSSSSHRQSHPAGGGTSSVAHVSTTGSQQSSAARSSHTVTTPR